MTHKKGDKFIGKCWLCGSVCNCEIRENGYERATAIEQKTCLNCGTRKEIMGNTGKPKYGIYPCAYCKNGYGYKDKDGACTCKNVPLKYIPKRLREPVCKLPWEERVTAISIHPDMANRDDIARLAAELIDARGTILTAIGGIEALLVMSDRVPTAEDFEVVKQTLENGLKVQEKK